MDPITVILTALATGAAKAATDVAPDAYKGLKALIQKRFAGKPVAEMVLDQYQKAPQTYSEPLKESLIEVGADKDEEILAMLEQIKSQAQAVGTTTNVGQGAKGNIAQIITNATITNMS